MSFETTQVLYGIDPTELAGMSYKEALKYKRSFLKGNIDKLIDDLSRIPQEKQYYEEICGIDMMLKKKTKALELVELQLDELKR